MEIHQETPEKDTKNEWEQWHEKRHPRAGRILGGFVLVGIGVVLFMEKMGYYFPSWVFTWKMGLIALGVFIGARHLFRGGGWLIPIVIGSLFLLDEFIPGFEIRPYIWPIVIVLIGLFMVFRPKRKRFGSWQGKWKHKNYQHVYQGEYKQGTENTDTHTRGEDRLEATVVFAGTKKNIITKNFKGGEVTCVFGGAEINLSQADISGTVVLDMTQVFGGTKLIVPPHWKVNYGETVSFMGGIEDRRPEIKDTDPNKILIIKGTSVCGGLEISSY
jgi:predicted membrane protein